MQESKLHISFLNNKDIEVISNVEYSLSTDDIIIYSIYLPDFIDLKTDLSKFLTSKEMERANRFHRELDKNRYIIYRSILKFVLAAHTKLNITDIQFGYHSNKKPYLVSHPLLHFNISHSEDYAVIAISRKNVGIDIEFMPDDFDFTTLLLEVFGDKEIVMIQSAANKKKAFYTLWTRKEAFVKALGKGIDKHFKCIPSSDGQHSIDAALIKNNKNWQVLSYSFTADYVCAIAFEDSCKNPKKLMMSIVPSTMKNVLQMIPIRSN